MKREEKVHFLIRELKNLYPGAECMLNYNGMPDRLVIATILSAQTTDKAVNRVTPALWKKYPSMEDLASADQHDVEETLKSIGLFRNKAASIIKAAGFIALNGLPDTITELVKIPGVGRKTANVIMGEVFGKPSVTVDTHVIRLSARLGLSLHADPGKIEKDLKEIVPEEEQIMFSHCLITHGRQVCRAGNPLCDICTLCMYCSFHEKREP
jgi:endonuclease-3